ncbi:MAG: hypothetical protein H6830_01010 [Planctomycetes bacterium]|nr:hypothetical protein [Planctomycetota bacterium]MCB9911102.1 hypothetical protein [Planctomycetota bacterium]MCB9912165.1 hypothetical protein [Planctomycetota bacterium]HRV82919.1 hypothetical protein [Planctomycetota bacterium]
MALDPREPLVNRTADLATAPRERLLPLGDLAQLLGCESHEIERWALALGLRLEPLAWRGVQLLALRMQDALAVHLAVRTPAAPTPEPIRIPVPDPALERAWEEERNLRLAAEAANQALQTRLDRREAEMGILEDRLDDLERVLVERRRLERELEALRAQSAEANVRQRELVERLQAVEETRRFLEQAVAERNELEQELEELRTEGNRANEEQQAWSERLQAAEVVRQRLEADLEASEQCAEQRLESLRQVEQNVRERRQRTLSRVQSLRRRLRLAGQVEENLEHYCERLEARLVQNQARWRLQA